MTNDERADTLHKHTPGPWHVTRGPAPREIRADHGPFIASVYDVAVTCGERNANARLLAAAPELLDVLNELILAAVTVDDGCAICGCDLDATPPHYAGCAVSVALAAIAKVEGEPARLTMTEVRERVLEVEDQLQAEYRADKERS